MHPSPARRRALRVLAPVWLVSLATADGVHVTMNGPFVESVQVGDYVVPAHRLAAGKSRGEVSFEDTDGLAIRAADMRNLGLYFARMGTSPDWTTELGAWHDVNGPRADFFLFEVGGNDTVVVAARLSGGVYGQEVTVTGWTPTGFSVSAGPNAGQQVYGLAFSHRDLLDAAGNPLAPGAVVHALRVRSAHIDGAALLFVDPDPQGEHDGDGSVRVEGERRVWHPLTLEFDGPWAKESDASPDNPFLDRRLQVRFDGPDGAVVVVPGYFAGDGKGADMGTRWRAHFTPEVAGTWRARATFRVGQRVAIDTDPNAGTPGLLNGVQVEFHVAPPSIFSSGLLAKGRLRWVGSHHRRFADGGYYLKAGTNSPENMLAFRGFDGVLDAGGGGALHAFAPHVADWQPGDPLFESDVHDTDSRGIIGALNYLASQEVDSIFVLLLNLGGDGCDVHPFVGTDKTHFDKTHYDVSRLDQWNQVFSHAVRRGIALHLGLAETEPENETWLDGGALGVERKLFYREMVARFAHHPAIKWTLSEENDYSIDRLEEFADWIRLLDAYDHPIAIHNRLDDFTDYTQIAGDPRFQATALQYSPDEVEDQIEDMRELSAGSGHPWVVDADENAPADEGLSDDNADELRKRVLWDAYFSGSGGVEWYFGYHALPVGGDLDVEDFRTREEMWRYMRHARRFVRDHLPFWEMEPADHLLSLESSTFGGGEVFVKPGEVYAVYLPSALLTGVLDLTGTSGSFTMRWFDPREGELVGAEIPVLGGLPLVLGVPPGSLTEDWVVLVERDDDSPPDLVANVDLVSVASGGEQRLRLRAGPDHAGRSYLLLGTFAGTSPGMHVGSVHLALNADRYTKRCWVRPNQGILVDSAGTLSANGEATARIVIPPGHFAPLVGSTLHHAYVLTDPWIDYGSISVRLRLVP